MREIKLSEPQLDAQPKPQPESISSKTFLRAIPKRGYLSRIIPIVLVLIIIALGVFSGLVWASRAKNAAEKAKPAVEEGQLSGQQKISFNQTFSNEAEGTIEKNDKLDKYGQGTHRLIRPGGESQTAYLTSTVLDLDQYVGKKVKVFGETFGSSQVGWLMDVGKVEVE